MSKTTTGARRQRRSELRRANFLKIKNMYARFSPQAIGWYNKMQEDGRAAFLANENRVNDAMESQLQSILNGLKETWANSGYDASEIALLEEAWLLTTVKDADRVQRRADKKNAKQLHRRVKEFRSLRTSK